MQLIKVFTTTAVIALFTVSCTKYREIGDAPYSDQRIYMPAAVDGTSINGIYIINKVAVPGQVFRYTADVAAKKLNIPLGVYRSGADTKGAINVTVSTDVDTVNKMLSAGKFPSGTEVLTMGKYTMPSTLTISDGADYAGFNFVIDLDFLLANLNKKYAVGVGVSSPDKKTGQYGTTVMFIDPTFLVPAASFTASISTRTVNFSNNSLNAVTYIWDYGDGTPVSTAVALPHTYAAAGTYNIKLVSSGALGDYNKSTYTTTVLIP